MTQFAKESIRNKVIVGWTHDNLIKNLINKYKEKNGTDYYCQNRPYNMPTKHLEVVNKTHLGFGITPCSKSLEK
jgi:hypothetical protein